LVVLTSVGSATADRAVCPLGLFLELVVDRTRQREGAVWGSIGAARWEVSDDNVVAATGKADQVERCPAATVAERAAVRGAVLPDPVGIEPVVGRRVALAEVELLGGAL
jgi:hypothetical protein